MHRADANGNLPAAVRHANKMADVLAAMCGAVLSRGGDCWVETSPSRGIGSAFPLEGRESHVGMLEHPSVADLAQKHGLKTLHFDQCMTRERPQDTPQKKTALLYSRGVARHVEHEFLHLMCNHPPGTHSSMLGLGEDGLPRSSQRCCYTQRDLLSN